jgi:hypothetical protein
MRRAYATTVYTGQESETHVLLVHDYEVDLVVSQAEELLALLDRDRRIHRLEFRVLDNRNEPIPITVDTFVADIEDEIDEEFYERLPDIADGVGTGWLDFPAQYEHRLPFWVSHQTRVALPVVDYEGVWLLVGHNPSVEFLIHRWHTGEDTAGLASQYR